MNKYILILGSICSGVIIITGLILIILSVSIVEIDEYGLVYDHVSQEFEDVKTSGRYFLGIHQDFVKFPRGYINIIYSDTNPDASSGSLSSWTSEGMTVYLDLFMYLELNQSSIKQFYLTYGDNWKAVLIRMGVSAVKDVAPSYTTNQFFTERNRISAAMKISFQQKLTDFTNDALTVHIYQINKISFHSSFESSVISKIIEQQKQQTAAISQELQLKYKQIDQIEADTVNQIKVINGEAQAEALMLKEKANAEAFKTVIQAYCDNYKLLFDETSLATVFDTYDKKTNFMYAVEISQLSNVTGNIFVGIGTPYISTK